MILLSVGTQLAFPRLVAAVDMWAEHNRDVRVVGQIGPQTQNLPRNIEYFDFMPIDAFERLQCECTLMISHAGVGSILKAADFGKPIIIMPRRGDLAEHRSNHQMATARYFVNMANVMVAADEFGLLKYLNDHRELRFQSTVGFGNSIDAMCEALSRDICAHRGPGPWLRLIRKLGV